MELLVRVGVSIVTEIGKYSVKPIIRHVGYLFYFKKNVDDLGIAKGELKLKYETVKADVKRAMSNTEVMKNDVEAWLNNVKEVVEDAETLENKIQANKMCCNGWSRDWIWQYKQSKEATQKRANVNKALQDAGSFSQPITYRAPTPGLEIFSSSDFEAFESRKLTFGQIMEALQDDNCSRIGVWGMGGVGKTTLVKQVSKKAKELNFFNDIVMAVVSQPPDIIQIQKEIADCLNLELKEESASGKSRRICMRIKNVEKILVILDDIWEEVNLEEIGIPSHHDHKGCKILITTRNDGVCNVMSCEKKVPVEVISEEESLALFKKSACINDDSIVINDDVVGEVVKECQGLPIAIVVVGKALIKKSLNDWKAALQQLRNSKLVDIEGVNVNKNAYVCLKWSYDRLKHNTKLCFLLCSLFPEDYKIPIEELTRYAIGMEVYDDVMEIEERRRLVYSSINALRDSSLLLVDEEIFGSQYGTKYVKMHDMVRDVALWIASKGEEELSLRTCTRLENIKNIENAMVISLWANNTKLPDKLVCSKLNILSLGEIPNYQLENLPEISDTLFEGMKGLKVLSLRNKFLSSQSLQFLTNLRCLYLVNCNFDDLSSLGKLKSLEILSFSLCRIAALPNELGELNNLKVLDLLNCSQLKISPNLIQSLSLLKELYISNSWFANFKDDGTSIEIASIFSLLELMPLSNLVVLSFLFNVNNLPNAFVFPKLERYDISISGVGSYEGIKDYPESRVLKIRNVNASSLNAFKELFRNVEELHLYTSEVECITDEMLDLFDMPSLRTLWEGPILHTTFHNLISLNLCYCNRLTNLFSPPLVQNLEKLEILSLECCSELKQIISEEKMLFEFHHTQLPCFPKLKDLTVVDCRKLEYLFSISVARGFLLQLEKLIIEDLPELKQVFRDERKVDVGLDGDKFELSKLRGLMLNNLPKMSNFCQANISSTWPSLEMLLVVSCPKMTSFIVNLEANVWPVGKNYVICVGGNFEYFVEDDSKYSEEDNLESRFLGVVDGDASLLDALKVLFYNIEVLKLEKCEVEYFIDTTGGNNAVSFSNLVELILKDMPSLRTMWEGTIQQTTFRNLTVLKARSCNRLSNLFSPSLVQNLENLETLILENCHELKQIISEEEMLFNSHIQSSCFSKLRILKVIDCGKLEYLFSISVARGLLLQLEELKIKDLLELKQVFCDEREGEIRLDGNKFELSKMRELSLENLPKLRNFFQGNISSTWPSLERLSMMSCPKIMSSFVADLEANMSAIEKKLQVLNVNNCSHLCNTVLDLLTQGLLDLEELKIESCGGLEDLFQRERLLPSRLKILILKDLLVQRCVWKGPTQLVNFNNLKEFEVCRCNRLRQLFSRATLSQSLQQLEYLRIKECDELENLIAEDEEDQILLEGHPELVYLNNLKSFEVFKCKRLKHLFTPTLARSLQQLCYLTIKECDELENLIAEDEEDHILSKGHLQPLYFSELVEVVIEECNKMKSLFHITIAHNLQQLGRLEVKIASQLVEVFAHENEGDVGVRKDIRLRNLRELSLERLPSLVSFCPRNYHFILRSLDYLKVLSCPNIITSFARTPYSTTIVHVNGEVPQLDEKDDPTVLSTTSQVVATNKDIDWDQGSEKIDALPLLKEELQK